MNSIWKYYIFFCWVFLISTESLYSKTNVILSKGRIEFLVDEEDLTFLQLNTSVRDSLFSCANGALTELELHLSYKLSEPIRLAIFSNISDFEYHRSTHSSKYLGVLLCGNIKEISYQIRYHVASHFIDEYLMGISVRERLERIKADRVPNWLKKGFIQYFAQGITYRDFELFRKWSQEGRFRNINFISENEQEIFGSVIWYLFEKEKGRSIDGAFWMLIKNANSFEKSFSYQFDQRFKSWLQSKFEEINNRDHSHIQSDNKFTIPNKNLLSIQVLQKRNNTDHHYYSLITNSGNSELIRLSGLNQKIEKISKFKHIRFNQNLVFTEPTFEIMGSDKSVFYKMHWEQNVWKLFSDTQVIYIPNEQNGLWKIIHSTPKELVLSHEIYDFTDIYVFSINDKKRSKIFRINNDKLTGWTQNDSIFYYTGASSYWCQLSKQSYVAKVHKKDSKRLDKIWESVVSRWHTDLSNPVLESNIHLSFVKSQETKSELIHLFNSEVSGYDKIATSIKGDFYGQIKLNDDSMRLAEWYLLNNVLMINLNASDEIIVTRDTVNTHNYTFDLALSDSTSSNKKSTNYSTESLFLSDYEKVITGYTESFGPIIQREEIRMFESNNWFYAKNSNFYLSNKDIDVGYSRLIPITDLYNSPLTLFYSGNFFNHRGKDRFQVELHSNFNRRRIGFSANYSWENTNWLQNFNVAYRQRQYRSISTFNQREQAFYLSHRLELKKNRTSLITPFILSKGQWVTGIALNYSPEISSQLINRDLLLEVELGVSLNTKYWKQLSTVLHSISELKFQNGRYSSQYMSGLVLKSESTIKTQHFDFFSRLSGKYSFTDANHLFVLGGTKGWINTNANTNVISNNLESMYSGLVYSGGYVRGTQFGSRMGNSFLSSQSEIHYKPLKLIKSYILGSSFWKQLSFFGFYDFAIGFVGGSSRHYNNPYNTVILDFPNYVIKVGANRNPWISSVGFGAQIHAFSTDFRVEFPRSIVGDEPPRKSILISLGKNF